MYKEILELRDYCKKHGISVVEKRIREEQTDCLKFNNGDDVIQHRGSFGCERGYVEFATDLSKRMSYVATTLVNAKRWVLKHKDNLNKVKE